MHAESFAIEDQEPDGARQHLELYMQLDEDEKQAAFASFNKKHAGEDSSAQVSTFGGDLASSVDVSSSSSDTKGDLQGDSIQYIFAPESEGWGYGLDDDNPAAQNVLSHGLGGIDGLPEDTSDVVPPAPSPLQVLQILQSASVLKADAALQSSGANAISQAPSLTRVEPHVTMLPDHMKPSLTQGDALKPAPHARLPQETHNLSGSDNSLDRGRSDVGLLYHVQGSTAPDFSHTAGGLGAGGMSSQRRQVDDVQNLPALRVPKLPSPCAHARGGRPIGGIGGRGGRETTRSGNARRFAAPPVPKLPLECIEIVHAREDRGDCGVGKRHKVSEMFDDRDRNQANVAIVEAAARPPQLGVHATGFGLSTKLPPTPANSAVFRTPTPLPSRIDGVPTGYATLKGQRRTSPLHPSSGVYTSPLTNLEGFFCLLRLRNCNK